MTDCMIDGDPASHYCFVLMAPGNDEIKANRPVVGSTGRLLWSFAKEAGIDRADCYILNTIGELPDGADGNPSWRQLDKYWEKFDDAFRQSKARVVALFGRAALQRVTGCPDGIEAWRGYVVTPKEVEDNGWRIARKAPTHTTYKSDSKDGKHKKGDPRIILKTKEIYEPWLPENCTTVLPILHPAAILKSGFTTAPVLKADILRIGRAGTGNLRPSRQSYSEAVVLSTKAEPRSFDIETGGISGGIVRLGVANGLETWTVPWGSNAVGAARTELDRLDSIKIAHNIAFDIPRLEAAGVNIPDPIWDTMLAAAMLQPDIPKGLKYVAPMYLDIPQWEQYRERNPAYYNAADAMNTLALYHVLRAELEQTGQLAFFEGTIMPTIRTLIRMSDHGIKLDGAARDAWIKDLAGMEGEKFAEWQQMAPGVNPFSPQQLKRYLYDELHLPFSYNKYGKVSTEEAALRDLMARHPEHLDVLGRILNLREIRKDLGTYAKTRISADGCVHPSYLPAGKDSEKVDAEGHIQSKGLAGTWRITARDPNIQNQPEKARRMYVPHDPANHLVELDYDQIEARLIATFSGDRRLGEAIAAGLHTSNMALLGVDKTRAKNAFYGWSYGAGAPTLVKTFRQHGFNVSSGEAKVMLAKFNGEFADAAAWRERIIEQAQGTNYLENPFGLRRYFYARGRGPAAANYLPQSTAAGIMWSILGPIERYCQGHGGHLLATVHDSILVELPKWNHGAEVRKIMEQEWHQIAPKFKVPVSIKTGTSWGTLTKV